MNSLQPDFDTLISTLKSNPDLPVKFTQNDRTILPGYHITEVKVAAVNSLDCGQGTDQWRELVIQLLDGNAESTGTYMRSAKMIGILDKALHDMQADDNTNLYFEFTPGNAALQKSSVSTIEVIDDTITVALNATTAQCKPYQRALASGKVSASSNGCCGSAVTQSQACCSTSTDSSCCT